MLPDPLRGAEYSWRVGQAAGMTVVADAGAPASNVHPQ
jgi:hypothetical protein